MTTNKTARIEERGELLVLVVDGRDVFATKSTETMWQYVTAYRLVVANLIEVCG